jgi:hypothetical protein
MQPHLDTTGHGVVRSANGANCLVLGPLDCHAAEDEQCPGRCPLTRVSEETLGSSATSCVRQLVVCK